jgi:glyoxylase-like metal-dependent hydrolase (beta-lactamase superfamily II)
MITEEILLRRSSKLDTGRVRQFVLQGGKTRITEITTFCPDIVGPGPTNLFLIESNALILVDAGMPTHLAKAFFYYWRNQPIPKDVDSLPPDYSEQELLEGLNLARYSVSDIDLLVISHGHPDHFLMANTILNRCSAGVSAHILDTPAICNPWGMLHMWFSRQEQMMSTGMPAAKTPPQLVQETSLQGLDFDSLGVSVRVDAPFFHDGPLTIQGTPVPGIEVRRLPGHSPGSVGLIIGQNGDEKTLISGDVLLNPITPHPDDLLVYLQTIDQLGALDDIGLVLPAHGQAIRNLKPRLDFLRDHHRDRLKLTYEACNVPRSVWDIATMGDYFDTYVDPKKFNFLAGLETLVHVEILNMVQGVERTHIQDEVHFFKNRGEPFDEVYGRITELVKDKGSRALMRY